MTQKRNHKVKCQFGMADYFRYYKNNAENPQDRKVFSEVFKEYLEMNRTLISTKGYIYVLPQRMGRIEIRKSKREVKIDKDGNIINKLAINWQATKKLWKENEEAKNKKIKIRYTNEHTNGYVFRPVYMKNSANYKNKSVYKMKINRKMARDMYEPIISGKLDAFLLNPI